MPPSSGEIPPRTPDRRSSASNILTAFRNLTSTGRPKNFSQASVLPPALTPVQSGHNSDIGKDVVNKRSFSENGSISTASQAASDDVVSAAPQSGTSVVGGPPEFDSLLVQLRKDSPLSERIDAALKMRDILDEYKISSPLVIWSVGEDLLSYSSEDASRAGMALLLGCAGTSNLTASERHILFNSLLATEAHDNHLDLWVHALIALTNDGRNVDSFEGDVLSLATKSLRACYKIVDHERKAKRSNGSSQESTLNDIFKYIVSVVKFNAKVFEDRDLHLVVRTVNKICQATTASQDVENSIDVVVALLTFTQLPPMSLRDCLELLADIYRQVEPLRDRTWDVLAKIFTSHLGHTAMLTYLDIIQDGGESLKRMVCRGSFRLMARLFEMNCAFGLPQVQLAGFLAATRRGLRLEDRLLAADVLQNAKELVFRDDLRLRLHEELDWESFMYCVKKAADILDLDTFNGISTSHDDRSIRSESTSRSEHSERTTTKRGVKQRETVNVQEACRNLHEVVLKLAAVLTELDVLHKDAVIGLLLNLGPRLSNAAAEVLITCCAEDGLIMPSRTNWDNTCRTLIVSFLHDSQRPSHLRSLVISVFKQAWNTIELVFEDASSELALLVLQKMDSESDGIVLDALASFAVMVVDRADTGLSEAILTLFRVTVFQRRPSLSTTANLSPIGGFPIGLPAQSHPSLCRTATKHVIRMFINNVNMSARKAEALYSFILKVAASSECAVDARICAIKLLFRLRATSSHAIYIKPLSESERIAAVLCRTAETANWTQHMEDSTVAENREGTGSGHQPFARQKNYDMKRPVPPLWFYPGPKGLPEEPPAESSIFVYSYQDAGSEEGHEGAVVLRIAYWLETLINLLQQQDTDWEIYSYLVVHLGAQLTNQNLFRGCIPQVQFLRNVLCDQIRAASFREPPSYTSLKKADVAVCLFHTLTMLVAYHDHFARSEEDEMVRAFVLGIGSWDRTSKWCIHALSICCHELPLSVSKMLDIIIQKMSQIITQSQVAVHILEFLVMLARLPDLYKNFRENEYKMVFGVSFRYLQYVRDKQERELGKDDVSAPGRPTKSQMRHSDSFRELRMLSDSEIKSKVRANIEDLPQYVYALAFHVITFWFMNLRLDDRPMYMPWISKNLTYESHDGKDVIEDQGLVTMDMMEKVAYTDRDETAYHPHFAKETDGEVAQRTWIIGYSLLTVETAGRTGVSQVVRRRPSGTKYSIFKPELTSPPRHQVPLTTGLAADAFYTSSYTGVLPEDVIQEFYASYSLLDPRAPRPIPLPDDDGVNRAISSFDRNSTVDGHKVGVIYIGEGQKCEGEILSNSHGSADYTRFIASLGFLTRLKNAQFNTQGLDRSEDTDGLYTYCWRDRATEMVFHITTMMPTDIMHDPQGVKKKSHVGNDFVNIVWNDSGVDFKFDTFPSAFNYVYIVITPESIQSFAAVRDDENPPRRFFRVQVLSAPGFPNISPAAETKLLSTKALPDFVRLLALNASVFSLVWQNREGGEHFSPWRNRLREIKRLRDKYVSFDGRPIYAASSPAAGAKIVPPTTIEKAHSEALTGGTLISPSMGRERGSALSHRLSLATFSGSEDLSRSSLTTSSAGDRGGHDSDR